MQINKKAIVFFVFLIVASIFWLLHALSATYTSQLALQLVYRNYVYADGDPSNKTEVTVEIEGRGYEILFFKRKYNNGKIPVDVRAMLTASQKSKGVISITKIVSDYFMQQGDQIKITKTDPQNFEME